MFFQKVIILQIKKYIFTNKMSENSFKIIKRMGDWIYRKDRLVEIEKKGHTLITMEQWAHWE